jgi:transketolase
MALEGLLPVCHSFACFLAPRANEQIYNAASERRKIIYVGALAGLLPGGPGHSHQSVRDIAALGAVPGLRLVEPCTETETAMLLEEAVEGSEDSTFIRLTSIPVMPSYQLPDGYLPIKGQGVALKEGGDFTVIGYGPVLLNEAALALEILAAEGVRGRLINLPWLNRIDRGWLETIAAGSRLIVALDNHYDQGGQGMMLGAALAGLAASSRPAFVSIGLDRWPECGRNHEVLAAHGLNADELAKRFRSALERC